MQRCSGALRRGDVLKGTVLGGRWSGGKNPAAEDVIMNSRLFISIAKPSLISDSVRQVKMYLKIVGYFLRTGKGPPR